MILAYLESIKYVGHLWPVALMRIVFGYQYLMMMVEKVNKGYLEHAYISERLVLDSEQVFIPAFYFELVKSLVQTQWFLVTYILIAMELVIGISYIIGFGVRLAAIVGMILSMHIYLFFDFPTSPAHIYLFYTHFFFCLLGAGRCLGVDYYFYKSRRGLLW